MTNFSSFLKDPTKFFGCELGAQTQFDVKNDRYIVNGSHEANKLQDMLDGFIKKFVLCPECENPETDLVGDAFRMLRLYKENYIQSFFKNRQSSFSNLSFVFGQP